MLKVEHVTKYYGNFKAVDDLSFEVKEGEIFGLLGVNGAGKTTTFRMIMGLLEPNSGSITLNGKPISYDVTDEIGFLTEERSLLTKMTVKDQVVYYGILKGMSEDEILKRLDYYLDKFDIKSYKDKPIKELSKGNQQKIQFITAIINKPKLLILDEPFSGLDPINTEMFKKEIVELSKAGSMIILSTHRMEHVELFCEKLVILSHGKSILSGYLKKIKEDYAKKNILVQGDIKVSDLKDIKGVVKVTKEGEDIVVKVEDKTLVDNVFSVVKKHKNITKFVVEEPTLNEIFIDKVGSEYGE
jgi:ABC-2 type transport system ATP-binding protein